MLAVSFVQFAGLRLSGWRHEAVDGLSSGAPRSRNRFARSPLKHGLFLHAIANIVQLGFMCGEMTPSFDMEGVPQPPSWLGTWFA